MRERAVGQRIMMYWHIDDSFYPATITAFDESHYRHRVEHDDRHRARCKAVGGTS